MTAARLLKLFDRVADAPDATERLRDLVLQLAVRGRLCPQDPREEPAQVLLSRVSGQNRGHRRDAGSATTTRPETSGHMFQLPRSWAWARFGDITRSRDGERVPVSKEERNGRAKNFDYYGASGVIDKIDGYIFDKPLLLIGEDGANLINRSSPIAFIARGRYWVNNHAHVIDGFSEVFLRYLEVFINATDLTPYVTGTAQPKMNQAKMNSIPVAVPPEPEQQRIVAKVDELMALCDRLEAAQKEREAARHRFGSSTVASIATADTSSVRLRRFDEIARNTAGVTGLRSAVMELAVTGRLVPQHPDDAPLAIPSATLARQSTHGSQPSTLAPVAVRARFPKTWVSGYVAQWFEVSGGIQKTPARTPNSNPHPYVGVSNVHRGRLDLHTVKQFELVPGELDRFALKPGDLLVVEGNGSRSEVGRCALWSGEIEKCVHQNHIIRCRPRADWLSPFTLTYLNSPLGIELLTSLAITSSGLYSLSVGKIRAVPIVMPPLAEQRRIVAKVAELMALCDQLEAHLKAGDIARSRLLDALIAETLAEPHAQSA